MEIVNVGRTGLQVSELCLGTMTFGREIDDAASRQLLDRFVEAGGNFIDTANSYSAGRSEEIIGSWMTGKGRHELVIATKVRFGSGTYNRGLSRKHILDAVDNSLRRLKTDYIDLYQMHMWDYSTPIEEALATLDTLVRSGKIRYVGISNVSGWQLQKAVDLCNANGWEGIACLQPLYNLLDREAEWELLPVCLNEGIGVIPWSPLRGGWLTGKYRRGMPAPQDTRIKEGEAAERSWTEEWINYNNDTTWNLIDALIEVAETVGKTPAQVALNWLLRQPAITAPILGVRTAAQLEDNLGAAGWSLDDAQVQRLTDASEKRMPYPYALLRDLKQV